MTQLSLLPMLSNVTLTSTCGIDERVPRGRQPASAARSSAKSKRQKTLVQFAVSAAVNPSTTTGEGT